MVDIATTWQVLNTTNEDWDHISFNYQLFNAAGTLIMEGSSWNDDVVLVGDFATLKVNIHAVHPALFDGCVEKSRMSVYVVASQLVCADLGDVVIPQLHHQAVSVPGVEIEGKLKLLACSVWRTTTDEKTHSRLSLQYVAKKLASEKLHEVRMKGRITGKGGRFVDEISTGGSTLYQMHFSDHETLYAHDSKLRNTKLSLTFQGLLAVGRGEVTLPLQHMV